MSMTCVEFEETAGAFVLGALDEEERRACLAHLRAPGPHARCVEALSEARQISAHLAATLPQQKPSAMVWNAIEARIGKAAPDRAARMRGLRELAAWFIAAAVLGLYLHAGYFETRRRAIAQQPDPSEDGIEQVRAAVGLLGQPGTHIVPFRAPDGAGTRAGLVVTSAGVASVLAADIVAGREKALHLWVQKAGDEAWTAAGTLHIDGSGLAAAPLDSRLLATEGRIALSVDEPQAPAPTSVLMTADLGR